MPKRKLLGQGLAYNMIDSDIACMSNVYYALPIYDIYLDRLGYIYQINRYQNFHQPLWYVLVLPMLGPPYTRMRI